MFVDSDVLLDALLKRREFALAAMNILALSGRLNLFTSSVAFVNVHYFLDKFDRQNKFQLLKVLRAAIRIINVDEKIIDNALNSGANDFEDAVQHFAALSIGADVIVTRNIKDYKQSDIPVLTPEQFLNTL